MNRGLLYASVAVLAAAVFWALAGREETEDGQGSRPETSAPSEPEESGRGPEAAAPLVVTPFETAEARPPKGEAAEAEQAILPAPETGIAVRAVLEEDPEQGVPLAEVVLVEEQDLAGASMRRDVLSDPLGFARRHGRRYRADEEGRLLVPEPSGHGLLFAIRGMRMGSLSFDGSRIPASGLQIPLREVKPARLRVLDAEGKPLADQAVSIRVSMPSVGGPGIAVPIMTRRTAPDGRVVFARHGLALGMMSGPPGQAPPRITARLEVPAAEAIEVPLPEGEEEAELRLPPCGRLTVRFQDHLNRPVENEAVVCVVLADRDQPQKDSRFFPFAFEMRLMASHQHPSPNGKEVNLAIPVGSWLTVAGARESGPEPQWSERVVLAGPTVAGEEVEAWVTLPEEIPSVTMRLLDEQARPLRSRRVRVRKLVGGRNHSNSSTGVRQTDEEGLLQLELAADLPREDEATCELRIALFGKAGQPPEGGVRLQVPPSLARRGGSLGDVVLRPLTLLAAGRVTDPEGNAVPHAHVQAHSTTALMTEGGSGGRTDAEGRFELRAIEAEGEISLQVSHERYQDLHREGVTVGTQGLEIVIEPAASLVMGVRGPQEVVRAWRFRLVGGEQQVELSASLAETKGVVTWRSGAAAPGTYELVGRPRSENEWTSLVQGIELKIGENRDPRLDPFDLSGLARTLVVSVRNRSGGPIRWAHVQLASATGIFTQNNRTDGEGRSTLVLRPDTDAQIVVRKEGYVTQRLAGRAAEVEVILLEAPVLTFRAQGLPSFPEGTFAGVHLQPRERQGQPRGSWVGMGFEKGDTVRLAVEPGAYDLSWFVQHGTTSRILSTSKKPPLVIEIGDGGRIIDLQAPAEALERLR